MLNYKQVELKRKKMNEISYVVVFPSIFSKNKMKYLFVFFLFAVLISLSRTAYALLVIVFFRQCGVNSEINKIKKAIEKNQKDMKKVVKELDFVEAARLRDEIIALEEKLNKL